MKIFSVLVGVVTLAGAAWSHAQEEPPAPVSPALDKRPVPVGVPLAEGRPSSAPPPAAPPLPPGDRPPAASHEAPPPGEASPGGPHGPERPGHWRGRRFRGGGGFFFRYYGIDTGTFSQAFTQNGLPGPGRGALGAGGVGYITTESGWSFGGSGVGLSSSRQVGANSAAFSSGFGGFYLAKDVFRTDMFEGTVGLVFGGGGNRLTVFSGNKDGEINETYLGLEPQLKFSVLATSFVKVGLTATWLAPVGQSLRSIGDDLGITKIAKGTWSMGVHLEFGSFRGPHRAGPGGANPAGAPPSPPSDED